MTKYQGHSSRAAWNVSLWINNDEGLYNLARRSIRLTQDRMSAARHMKREMVEMGVTHTPDGYTYSVTSIRKALVGL